MLEMIVGGCLVFFGAILGGAIHQGGVNNNRNKEEHDG